MIDTLIFDIGNVLLNFDYLNFYRSLYDEEIAQALADATLRKPNLWVEMDRGVMPYEEAIQLLIDHAPGLAHQLPCAIDALYRKVQPFSYAAPLLSALKNSGYRIYILSNYGKIPFQMSKARMDFLKYIDGSLISYEIQETKPNYAIYRALCDKFHISPQKAVFIDDSPVNIAGAQEFGLHTVLFTDYQSALCSLAQLPLAYGLPQMK